MSRSEDPGRDEVLLAGLLRREPGSIDRWFRGDYPRIYRLGFGLLGDHHEAEDLAAEAMLRILDHLEDRDPARSFRAWSNAIVINMGRDRLRRRRPVVSRDFAEADLPAALRTEDPARLEQGELRELITRSLTRLTDREREVFVLRELEALPTDEVARTLNITESSVRSLLTLARRRLRGLVERGLSDGRARS
ncbi:MAG: RNA polymerase sigma factor [Planctomycetes bacterium]|nr:RNA polymerase sigma factor [Planctomycetota bacterium]